MNRKLTKETFYIFLKVWFFYQYTPLLAILLVYLKKKNKKKTKNITCQKAFMKKRKKEILFLLN